MKSTVVLFVLLSLGVSAQTVESLKIKNHRIAILNDTIQETSGLTFVGPDLFTLNDSGNEADLYQIDKADGTILKTFKTGLKNRDWEALTFDGENIYVGDFGNNLGSSKNLKVYQIPYSNGDIKTDSIRVFDYYYPDQIDFSPKNINNDFDAEAMFYEDSKIHILTKEWASKAVSHYTLDLNVKEKQPAKKLESYPTGFVVTDSSIYNGKLYTVGYTKGLEVFMMIFTKSEGGFYFKQQPVKYKIGGALSIGQVEGIAVNEDGIYISAESFKSPLGATRPSLYFVAHEKIK